VLGPGASVPTGWLGWRMLDEIASGGLGERTGIARTANAAQAAAKAAPAKIPLSHATRYVRLYAEARLITHAVPPQDPHSPPLVTSVHRDHPAGRQELTRCAAVPRRRPRQRQADAAVLAGRWTRKVQRR
jgi:hypothetical protein